MSDFKIDGDGMWVAPEYVATSMASFSGFLTCTRVKVPTCARGLGAYAVAFRSHISYA